MKGPLVLFLQSRMKALQRHIPGTLLRWIFLCIIKGYAHRVDQAVHVPSVQANGALPLVPFDARIQLIIMIRLTGRAKRGSGAPLGCAECYLYARASFPSVSHSMLNRAQAILSWLSAS